MSCAMDYPKFLLFGDSITEFAFNTRMGPGQEDQFSLGAALVNVYTRKMDIVQRGFSGYTSRWGLKMLPKILERDQSFVLATVFFGANDSCLAGPQSVPLDEYIHNIKEIIRLLKEHNIRPIVVGPAVHDDVKWKQNKAEEVAKGWVRSTKQFKLYSDAGKKLAEQEGVAFVDLQKAFLESSTNSDWRELLCDGLHFSGKGYEIFFNELLKAIKTNYADYAPENLEYRFPNWRNVAPDGSNLGI